MPSQHLVACALPASAARSENVQIVVALIRSTPASQPDLRGPLPTATTPQTRQDVLHHRRPTACLVHEFEIVRTRVMTAMTAYDEKGLTRLSVRSQGTRPRRMFRRHRQLSIMASGIAHPAAAARHRTLLASRALEAVCIYSVQASGKLFARHPDAITRRWRVRSTAAVFRRGWLATRAQSDPPASASVRRFPAED